MSKLVRFVATILLVLAAATAFAASKAEQTTTAQPATPPGTTTTTVVASDDDSRETRNELRQILTRYPPEVGTVLKLDPTLFGNGAYLANYPALAEFVAHHPDIAHNPSFFLEHVPGIGYQDPNPPEFRMWMQLLGNVGGFAVFLIITSVLVWAVKTLIQQRRWSRLSRIQTEVHSKLLDRFTSNEELLAYIQTPAGRRFLESAPIPLESSPQQMSAPVGRIFWSLQAGLVTAAAGVGLWIASTRFTVAASPLFAFAVIAICVGIAFVLSAFAFYVLSRQVGLWQTPPMPADAGGE
jgi:hypothetical protein